MTNSLTCENIGLGRRDGKGHLEVLCDEGDKAGADGLFHHHNEADAEPGPVPHQSQQLPWKL